jgi:Tol biopolymer transport system component
MNDTLKAWPLLQSPFNQFNAEVSPNGRWLAYQSAQSGTAETYVVPFPKGEGKWQISSGGSRGHYWNRDGSEIYYIDKTGKFVAVPVKSGVWTPGRRAPWRISARSSSVS